ncbi:RpiB/LacA/LacB family sugar-phosphate isomerase [Glutamicibacter uratoxydans]|uniref:RpiB/LacA/LacB family sugar-phosphate isomerase n=1 Tax=Glutamicibacter uratoxydans TaxID=43667 RepID=UPI003D6DAAE0
MRIHLGTNYQGWELAGALRQWLAAEHEVIWHGAPSYDHEDDYPHYAIAVARGVVADEDAGVPVLGISCGYSGNAEVICCNKVNGARAITASDPRFVTAAREQADANVLTLGAAYLDTDTAKELVSTMLVTAFSGNLDDARRIVNTAEFETSSTIEGWTLT